MLTKQIVAQYTDGRLAENDDETQRLLDVGLAAARRFCGWPVLLEEDAELELDGPGGPLLRLPTLRVVELKEIAEDGTALLLSDLYVSKLGMLRKKSGEWFSGNFGAITVKLDHGFESAPDFEQAVLSFIDRESYAPSGGRARVVGPFQYDAESMAAASAFSVQEKYLLTKYRIWKA